MSSLGAVINRHSCWVPHLTDYHPQSPSQPIQHSLRNPDAISSNNITPFASNRFKYTEADRRLDSIGDTTDGKNFVVLNEADIRQRLQDDSSTVSTNLSISGAAAIILLRHYHWSVTDVHEAWFADEDKVRKTVGLLEQQVVETLKDDGLTCGICFESYPLDGISTAACGHPFCSTCWKSYMRTSIDDGPGCLMLRCPHLGCHAAVDQDMISVLASDDDQRKYARHLLRSYIEDNLEIKWCPAEGCEYAVEFVGGSGGYDVACLCSHRFCWNCTEEAHHPVDCGTVAKWIRKYSGESDDTTWLCLVAWTGHTNSACERVEAAKQENDETERTREMAKNSLEKYTHYYKRWATNESLRQKALHDLHQMQNVQLEKLSDRQSQTKSQLKFIIEAWLQIVECRRVLKWTYVYGYYLPEDELAKKQLFEYLQGEAEAGLEKLHECAKDLQKYLTSETPNDFNDFQKRLAGLTSVTGNYFENLVRALEDGLSEVKGKSGRGKAASKTRRLKRNSDNSGSWYCDKCTYRNSRASTRCAICATMANEINKSPSN